MTSQMNAATRPEKRTALSTTSGCTIPLPMVVATATPKPKAATKLKNAAQTTAALGVSTRVDTTVAIEFAASWKPFMKSNARATRMRAPRASMRWEAGDGAAEDPIALVLEPIDLRTVRDQPGTVLQVPQHAHGAHELLDRFLEHIGELPRLGLHGADAVEPDALRGGVDQVEHVVQAGDEEVDVVSVHGSDEGLVEALDHGVRDLVALMLHVLHAPGLALGVGTVPQRRSEQCRRLARALGMLLEEVEELPAPAVREEPGEEIPPRTGGRHTPRA